ncbi:hypothetical protein LOAG_14228, partial [Loa loa]
TSPNILGVSDVTQYSWRFRRQPIFLAFSTSPNIFTSYRAFSSTNAMIDMLARVQRMCETTESIGSGSGLGKKYESIIQLEDRSDTDSDRRLSSCCFHFASCDHRSSNPLKSYELVCRTIQIRLR